MLYTVYLIGCVGKKTNENGSLLKYKQRIVYNVMKKETMSKNR